MKIRDTILGITFLTTLLFISILTCCSSDKSNLLLPGEIQISINNGPKEGDTNAMEENKLLMDLFKKKYPHIKLKYNTWQYSPETFLTKMAGATCTDVIGLFATEGVGVAEQGLAVLEAK